MSGVMSLSAGSMSSGSVHGLFPVCAGRMVTAGAARSGRRTPEPHVWPAAPLQFMRGDGWRGAAMEETTGKWVGLTDALRDIVSAEVWDQCRAAWEACQAKGGYSALAREFKRAKLAHWARANGSTSPVRNLLKSSVSPELQTMRAALEQLSGELTLCLCSSVERVRFYKRNTGDYVEPPCGFWRGYALWRDPFGVDPTSLEDVFRTCWMQRGESDRIPMEFIQIFRAVEAVVPEPAVRQGKRGYDDDEVLEKMKAGLESGKYQNLWQAACTLADEADGSEEEQAKEKRLVRKFKAKYRE